MNTIELKLKYHYPVWEKGDDKKYHPVRKDEREKEFEFDLHSQDEADQLIKILRMVDEDYNKKYGAWDRNLKYEITEIIFRNGLESGNITRRALDNKIGYKPLYPKSRD